MKRIRPLNYLGLVSLLLIPYLHFYFENTILTYSVLLLAWLIEMIDYFMYVVKPSVRDVNQLYAFRRRMNPLYVFSFFCTALGLSIAIDLDYSVKMFSYMNLGDFSYQVAITMSALIMMLGWHIKFAKSLRTVSLFMLPYFMYLLYLFYYMADTKEIYNGHAILQFVSIPFMIMSYIDMECFELLEKDIDKVLRHANNRD